MKLSPLQLLEYFVAEFHYNINTRFDAKKGLELKPEELHAIPQCDKHGPNPREWTVALEVKYQPAAETNTPYIFSLTLVGVFKVAETFDETKVELLVRTNGASMLYGIARELVREQTARGPDGPLILPTASFVPNEAPAQQSGQTISTQPAAAVAEQPAPAKPAKIIKEVSAKPASSKEFPV